MDSSEGDAGDACERVDVCVAAAPRADGRSAASGELSGGGAPGGRLLRFFLPACGCRGGDDAATPRNMAADAAKGAPVDFD